MSEGMWKDLKVRLLLLLLVMVLIQANITLTAMAVNRKLDKLIELEQEAR